LSPLGSAFETLPEGSDWLAALLLRVARTGAPRRTSALIALCLSRPPANFERSREVGD
jgi:hypothetical protein